MSRAVIMIGISHFKCHLHLMMRRLAAIVIYAAAGMASNEMAYRRYAERWPRSPLDRGAVLMRKNRALATKWR